MSIEEEKLNNENSLEQYGVWVKKSPVDVSDDALQMTDLDINVDSEDVAIGEEDFDSSSLEIFSDDIDSGEDIDIDFSIDAASNQESMDDDSDNSTLTTDELLNITSGMSLEEGDDSDLDIDFDSFMDMGDDASPEEAMQETNDEDTNSDFDLMSNDSEQSSVDVATSDDDDLSMSFDDFMKEESATEGIAEESPLDMDVSFDDMDLPPSAEDSITTYDMDIEENEPINLGEEITLDDIPNSMGETTSMDAFDQNDEAVEDFNISVDTDKPFESQTVVSQGADNADVLSKIVDELSNLRKEMSQFKSELAKIKTDGGSTQGKAEGAAEGGFFSDYEGDDTIALSGDELNNILTSADFTVDGDEESDEGASMADDNASNVDFDEDTDYFSNDDNALVIEDKELVEPSLDDIDFDMDSEDSLPDEIDVPVIEDLVVDSSPVNFFDEDEGQNEISDSSIQHLQEEPSEDDLISDMIIDEDAFDDPDEFIPTEISDSDVVEGYSSSDINDPVSSVFKSDQWESDISDDDDLENGGKSFGAGMHEEIKSVLSYMDRLLESLPEEKISEFAQSEYFDRYKKLFTDLGIS